MKERCVAVNQLRVAISANDKAEFVKLLESQANKDEVGDRLSFRIVGEPVGETRDPDQLVDVLLVTEGILAVAVPVLALWLGKGKKVVVKFGKDRLVLKNMREHAAAKMLREWLACRRNAMRRQQ
jgi:hypothetical protein